MRNENLRMSIFVFIIALICISFSFIMPTVMINHEDNLIISRSRIESEKEIVDDFISDNLEKVAQEEVRYERMMTEYNSRYKALEQEYAEAANRIKNGLVTRLQAADMMNNLKRRSEGLRQILENIEYSHNEELEILREGREDFILRQRVYEILLDSE